MELKIKNKYGELLSGILEGNSRNLIILCHGSRGTKESSLLEYLNNNLKNNFSVFRFDFSGNGDSEGLLENSTYLKEVEDLDSIINYFKSKNYNILSLIGHSKGGSNIFLYEKKYSGKVKSIIAFAPRFNLLESQEYIRYQDYKEDLQKNGFYIYDSENYGKHKITKNYILIIEELGNIGKSFSSNVPMIIFHGDSDKTIPIEDSNEFILKNPKVKLIIVENGNHSFKNNLNDSFISNNLKSWLLNL